MTGSSELLHQTQSLSSQGALVLEAWKALGSDVGSSEIPWRQELVHEFARSWPSAREEAWKYSPIAKLQESSWRPLADELRFELPEGVQACRLSAASGVVLDRARDLMKASPAHRFNALAWLSDPWVVYVPGGVSPRAPLRVHAPRGEANAWSCAGWLLVVDEDARLNVVENYGAQFGASSWGARIFLGSGSRVEHLRMQGAGAEAWGFAESIAFVSENAHYVQVQVSTGGRVCREDAVVKLQGSGAEAYLDATFMARNEQVLDHRTSIEHEVGDTQSHQLYKGLLADRSRGIFNGRVLIRRGANGANAAQLSQNLLLSPTAEINTKPELQIDADDVKASHGAAVGQLDAEHLFYLRSRGISEAKAKEVLLLGFALEALRGLQDAELKQVGSAWIETEANALLAGPESLVGVEASRTSGSST
jgi:Fe-S cluster assembly protein SufD